MAKPFDPSTNLYDQNTFSGRLYHFNRIVSPLNLLASDSTLKAAQEKLADYKSGKYTTEELWTAKYLVDATIHPDTKEKVFLPFRMASFVPTNLLVTVGLLLPNPSIGSIVFWQWINQSVNVGFNWSNANKTTQMTVGENLTAYGTAVTASVGIAVGLSQWVKRTSIFQASTKALLSKFVPFVAVASAGTVNVFLMRRKELVDGITVFDEDGNSLGKSKVAAWNAISQVAISRVAVNFPCLIIPPLIMSQFEKMDYFKGKALRLGAANVTLIAFTMITALPCAIALFPQRGKLDVKSVEKEFQDLNRKDGKRISTVYYNKGL
ncbi:hypothetical protein MP638_002485 [Amoeboaphelidium occidentale]|nr:hypothetical protein MP638_002485 [Amoeboaphelidium occidentale]